MRVLVAVLDNSTGLRADLTDASSQHLQRPGPEAQAAEELRLGRLARWQALPNLLRTDDTRRQDTVDVREARRADA